MNSDLERARHHFLAKVNKQAGRKVGELSECWLWEGTKHITGYGQYQTDFVKNLGIVYAHGAAYFLFRDQSYVPSRERQLSHLCENTEVGSHRPCCNPDHLVWKPRAENIADRDANLGAYQSKGAEAPGAKFTLDEARAIQQRHLKGEEYKDIAKALKVNRRTIERICCGQTYVELGDCRTQIAKQKEERNNNIIRMEAEGKSRKEICAESGMSAAYVSVVCSKYKKKLHPE